MASASPDRTTPWSLPEMVPQADCLASSAAWSPEGMGVWTLGGEQGWGSTILEKGGMPGSRGRCPRAASRAAELLGDLGLPASVSGAQFAQV